jgi:hypothetical protein
MGGISGGVLTAVTAAVATVVSATRTERTAQLITWPAGNDQAAELASLRTAIQSGNTIFANDLNRIGTLINNMNGHYHTYDDAYQLATFGNTGDRTNYIESKNTGGPDATATAPTNTAADTSITASRHNELKDSINQLRYHNHSIDDRTA